MSDATNSNAAMRPSKRRIDSQEFGFFTPAATSFKPRPYTPNSVSSSVAFLPTHLPSNPRNRPHELHAMPPAGMDPLPTDPEVVFIHPPFSVFPDSALYPDGISYQLLAENPEWFLDAYDFISQHNTNSNAIPYPPHLEPPRGWCPAKKKDLRDRGADGWPEGEEPRLRCTFCRRTYAGVNAKSMWRRHVFEKHRIAMSNRRDSNERSRGRGSNKENRQISNRSQLKSHDSLVNLDVTPQTEFRGASHKSKFRSLLPAAEDLNQSKSITTGSNKVCIPSASKVTQGECSPSHEDGKGAAHPLSQSHVPPLSPPLTPQSSDLASVAIESDAIMTSSSPPTLPTVPPSPYDPLLTPSFRHSPPRLPSDQPWRFPSPSHPLHSQSREIVLSMLTHDANSPVVKSSPVTGESPLVRASLIPSPHQPGSNIPRRILLDLGTPESHRRLSRQIPRALFSKSMPNSNGKTRYCIQESPLQRSSKALVRRYEHSGPDIGDEWLSGVTLSSSALPLDDPPELLPVGDPFAIMYSPWGSVHTTSQESDPAHAKALLTSTEAESPVLRNAALPVGIGLGLLAPFTFPECDAHHVALDSDFDDMLSEEEGDEAEVASFLAVTTKGSAMADANDKTPPLKKRRTTVENRK